MNIHSLLNPIFTCFLILMLVLDCGKKAENKDIVESQEIDTSETIEPPACKLCIKNEGSLDFVFEDMAVKNIQPRIAIKTESGIHWISLISEMEKHTEKKNDGLVMKFSKEKFPELSLAFTNISGDEIQIDVSMKNAGQDDFNLYGIEIVNSEDLEAFPAPVKYFHQGYQSWSFSGVVELGKDYFPPLKDGTIAPTGLNNNTSEETKGISWWLTTVNSESNYLTVAVLTSRFFKTRIGLASDKSGNLKFLKMVSGVAGDFRRIKAGENLELESYYITIKKNEFDGLLSYAGKIKQDNNLKIYPKKIIGWSSWYYYFNKVKEEDVLKNEEFVAKNLKDSGYDLIQIDDGYEKMWGDWSSNDQFPNGMAPVIKKITDDGFTAGIWIAPFLVDTETALFKEHPSWFLKDEHDEFILDKVSKEYGILDATNSEVINFFTQTIKSFKDMGITYFKLDFLYAGAIEGKRSVEGITGIEAFNKGMNALNQAIGNNFILACGAPFLPSLFYADGIRISPDIVFSILSEPVFMWNVNVFRETYMHFFLKDLLFVDPDNFLLRSPYDLDTARLVFYGYAVSGDIMISGDNLTELETEKTELLQDSFINEIIQKGSDLIPLDLFKTTIIPESDNLIIHGDLETASPYMLYKKTDKDHYVFIFNFTDKEKTVSLSDIYESSYISGICKNICVFEDMNSKEDLGKNQTIIIQPKDLKIIKMKNYTIK